MFVFCCKCFLKGLWNFFRFIGTTPRSSSIRRLLVTVLEQIKHIYSLKIRIRRVSLLYKRSSVDLKNNYEGFLNVYTLESLKLLDWWKRLSFCSLWNVLFGQSINCYNNQSEPRKTLMYSYFSNVFDNAVNCKIKINWRQKKDKEQSKNKNVFMKDFTRDVGNW